MKNLKKGILVILCLAGILTANAQDKIVKLNGETIDSKIKKIDNNIITFKKTNNPEGPDYALETREIDKVIFENGSVQVFNGQQITSNQPAVVSPTQNPEVKKTVLNKGKNIIAFAPLQFTNPASNSVGFGLHYERALDDDAIIAFYLPIAFTPAAKNDSNNYDTKFGNMFWAYPGLKIYPGGHRKVVNYALGASFVYGTGKITRTTYNSGYYYSSPILTTTDCNIYGMMLHNSLNIDVKSLSLGFEGGIGFPYSFSSVTLNDGPILQVKFFGGYRF